MSAPLTLTVGQLRRLSDFLEALSAATMATGVTAGGPVQLAVEIDGTALDVAWTDEDGYRIDDRCGS